MPSKVPMRGLRIDDGLYNKLCYLAKLENRSFNQEAAYILKRFVAEFEKQLVVSLWIDLQENY